MPGSFADWNKARSKGKGKTKRGKGSETITHRPASVVGSINSQMSQGKIESKLNSLTSSVNKLADLSKAQQEQLTRLTALLQAKANQ